LNVNHGIVIRHTEALLIVLVYSLLVQLWPMLIRREPVSNLGQGGFSQLDLVQFTGTTKLRKLYTMAWQT
jgi:hypothetical protein